MKPVFIEVTCVVNEYVNGDVTRATSWLNVACVLRFVLTSAADGTPRVLAYLMGGTYSPVCITLEHSIDEVLRRIKDA